MSGISSPATILVCEHLLAEVEACLEPEVRDWVTVMALPSSCERPMTPTARAGAATTGGCRACLIGGGCLLWSPAPVATGAETPLLRVHHRPACSEFFIGQRQAAHYQRQGAYLLTPGWLMQWREHLRLWGVDQVTARAFFRESCRRLLLLDTGVASAAAAELASLAAYLDLPAELLPMDLDLLRLRLAGQIQDWRAEDVARHHRDANRDAARHAADHAMTLDLLSRLARTAIAEAAVADGILDLCGNLFAPTVLRLALLEHGTVRRVVARPGTAAVEPSSCFLSDPQPDYGWIGEDGFWFCLRRDTVLLGVVVIEGLAFPRHRERYLNLALQLAGACALAIDNTRAYSRLEHANAALQEALANVKTLKGLLPVCAQCKRVRNDQGYWDQIDRYITDHSDAMISHSICPECYKLLYPEYFQDGPPPAPPVGS